MLRVVLLFVLTGFVDYSFAYNLVYLNSNNATTRDKIDTIFMVPHNENFTRWAIKEINITAMFSPTTP